MFCANCGTACEPEFRFCKKCGAPVGAGAAAAGLQAVPMAAVPASQAPAAAPPPAMYQQPMYQQAAYYVSAQAHTLHQLNVLQSMRAKLQGLASTESLEGFSLTDMFSEVFKKRGAAAVEDYILCGTSRTTPPIELVETGWPKPWLFFRVLAALVIAYVGLTFMFKLTGNTNCIPGMMFLGAFAVPMATLVLFFEWNTPRNVSVYAVAKLFLMGAVASLGVALLGYALPIFDVSTMEAGVVEECAKLLTVVVIMRGVRYKYILNGILFGATVGAGFAAFETAGYALNEGLLQGLLPNLTRGVTQTAAMGDGVSAMLQLLLLRGIEAPLGHVAWTALAAGAFWRVKQDRPTNPSMLLSPSFLKAFAIPVAMHALWDAPWQLPFSGNQILTGLITWYVVFGLVQQGLKQVKAEQKAHMETTLMHVEAQLQPLGTVAV